MPGTMPRPRLRLDEWLFLLFVASLSFESLAVPTSLFGLLGDDARAVDVGDLLALATVLAWGVALLRRRATLSRSRLHVPITVYTAALVVAVAASAEPRRGVIQLVTHAAAVLPAVVALDLTRPTTFLRYTLTAWLVGAAVTTAIGLAGIVLFVAGVRNPEINVALMGRFGSLPAGTYPRIAALYENSNGLCEFLAPSVAILLTHHALGWIGARWFRVLMVAILVILPFTLSPCLGGVALALGLWVWLRARGSGDAGGRAWRGAAALTAGGTLAAAMLLVALVSPAATGSRGVLRPLVDGYVQPIRTGTIAPSPRLLTWRAALDTIGRYPVLGRGPGREVASVSYQAPSGESQFLTDAHETWLSVAGQAGLVGLAAFVVVIGVLLRRVPWRSAPRAAPTLLLRQGLAVAFVAGFLYPALTSSLEYSRGAWLLAALLAAATEHPVPAPEGAAAG